MTSAAGGPRILLVSTGFPPRGRWGTESYTLELARGLARSGREVAVAIPVHERGRPRCGVRALSQEGLRLFLLDNPPSPRKPFERSWRNPDLERSFESVLQSWRPERVHFLHLLWSLSVRLPALCRARGIPTVLTLTDLGLLCHRGHLLDWRLRPCGGPHPAAACARCIRHPSRFDGAPLQIALKRTAAPGLSLAGGLGLVATAADVERREAAVAECLEVVGRLIAPTRAIARAFLARGVPPSRLTRLVYAFDQEPLRAARAAPPAAPVCIGYVGQYAPHKGLATLLEAVRILERRPGLAARDWKVRLRGAGVAGRYQRFPRAVLERAPSPRVEVLPPFEPAELAGVLAELHALVIPSIWTENAPLAALQARSAGLPVIASDVEGLAEVVRDGEHGRVFPRGDAARLADALEEVIDGRLPARLEPSAPMHLDEHVAALEAIYGRLEGTESGRPAEAGAVP